MHKRKVMVALCTSILAIIMLNIVAPVPLVDGGLTLGILVYATYVIPVVFIYGIITSIISDKISFKAKRYPNIFALALHMLFGLSFILPYGVLFESLPFLEMGLKDIFINPIIILSTTLATFFFFIDYIFKRGFRQKNTYQML